MFSIAICDDEEIFLNNIRDLVTEYFINKTIKYTVTLFDSGKKLIEDGRIFDLVFLDVEMSEMNGIETARKIRSKSINTIIFFITNYPKYIDEAFDVFALRYLPKPIDKKRFVSGMDSALARMEQINQSISVSVDQTTVKINILDIMYISIQGRKTLLVTTKRDFLINESFENIVEKINCRYFLKTHKSYCVNMKYVRQYTKEKVTLAYNDDIYEVHMSRRQYSEFKNQFFSLAGECE